jgi:hypothetical protein
MLISFLPALADAPLEGTKPAQWRLVWNRDPSRTATLVWNTNDAGTDHRLVYSERGAQDTTTIEATSAAYTAGTEPLVIHYHTVVLENLEPATAYEVEMQSDGNRSPKFYFVTAPDDDRPFSLLAGGDSRSDREQRRVMNQLLSRLFEESQQEEAAAPIVALAHGGDYVESGRTLRQWSEWMSDHELTTTSDGRLLPIIPTRGNHDGGPLFNEIFGFAPADLNYYGLSLGSEVRLVTLNTEIPIAGNQSRWLGEELATWRPQVRWLLAQYHRPAYPAVKTPSEALRFWVPQFEQHNVDLALEADGHVLKRTVPVRNGEPDETGVVYVGEGGLGVKQRTPKADRWFLAKPGMATAAHHVQLLTFTAEGLRYQAIDEHGKTLDELTLQPRLQEALR